MVSYLEQAICSVAQEGIRDAVIRALVDLDSEEAKSILRQNGVDPVIARGEEIKADLDRLLDEIDEILEEDSKEFKENYIQRGGE